MSTRAYGSVGSYDASRENATPGSAPVFTVSQFLDTLNQDLAYAFSGIVIEGEVASYKVSQGKWVFFDLKDDESSVNCFIPIWQLSLPLEDGMKVRLKALPKVTKWGKFSLTVQKIAPLGEGSIKKAYELLKQKLTKEGLFDPARKRPLPDRLEKIGVISSTGAAGFADFCKILNARWGGLEIQVCHTQVQGLVAPDQIIRALKYLNEKSEVDVIAIIRGGGSADDLSCFNDEALVRAIAASKIPVATGIGHEVDESLADLAADLRASTPSNCAELLTLDRFAELRRIDLQIRTLRSKLTDAISDAESIVFTRTDGIYQTIFGHLTARVSELTDKIANLRHYLNQSLASASTTELDVKIANLSHYLNQHLSASALDLETKTTNLSRHLSQLLSAALVNVGSTLKILESMNPDLVLRRGYAIISGEIEPGKILEITTFEKSISAQVKSITPRKTQNTKSNHRAKIN